MLTAQSPRLVERSDARSIYKGTMGGFLVRDNSKDENFWIPNTKGNVVMSLVEARELSGIKYSPNTPKTLPKSAYVRGNSYSSKKK